MRWLTSLLQLSDSAFPSGAYGHSAGLEYAIAADWVNDLTSLESWIVAGVGHSFATLDARACAKAWILCDKQEQSGKEYNSQLDELNLVLASFRAGRDQRQAQAQIGRSLARSAVYSFGLDSEGAWYTSIVQNLSKTGHADHIQFPLSWGILCRLLDIPLSESMEAFLLGYIRQAIMVAIKLIPLGQAQAFELQAKLCSQLSEHWYKLEWREEAQKELESFCLGLDIAGLGHSGLEKRYFRS